MRSLLVPLGFYLAVTVLVPILNGTARGAAFVEHVVIVLVVSAIVAAATGLTFAGRGARRRGGARARP